MPESNPDPEPHTPLPESDPRRPGRAAAAGRRGLELLPIRRSLRDYSWAKAREDFRAALNVALLDFPQGMAYALIAGLPVRNGIFCSALSSIVGPLFASSRFIMLGPTNATAVLLLSTFLALGLEPEERLVALPLLLVMVGAFMLIGALLRVAAVVHFISRSVVTGYITAAAALIIINQLKYILNVEVERDPTFVTMLIRTFSHLPEAHLPSLAVAGATLAVYLPAKRWLPSLPTVALTLVAVSAGTALAGGTFTAGLAFLEPVDGTAWPLTVPRLDFDLISQLGNAAFAIAFLSLLESSSIARTLAARAGERVDVNQQLFSTGAASLVNAFGSGMTVSGSLTRSMLNFASGARTPMASIFSGVLLVAGIFLLGPLIRYIPVAALAALVLTIGFSLINRGQVRVMVGSTRSDAIVFFVTFGGGLLFPLDTAIYVGAAASVVLFLRQASRPHLVEWAFNERGELGEKTTDEQAVPDISIVHVEGDLFFGSTEIFLDQTRLIVSDPNLRVIILRMRNARNLDGTCALAIGELVRFARQHNCEILISGAHPEIKRVLRGAGVMEVLGEENFFEYVTENPTISTRNALRRAQEITGNKSANIKLFAREKAGAEPAGGEAQGR